MEVNSVRARIKKGKSVVEIRTSSKEALEGASEAFVQNGREGKGAPPVRAYPRRFV